MCNKVQRLNKPCRQLVIPQAASTEFCLMFSWGCPQRKPYCLAIEGATHSTLQRHPPGSLTNIRFAAPGSRCSLMVQKSWRELVQKRNRKWCLKIHNSWSVLDCYITSSASENCYISYWMSVLLHSYRVNSANCGASMSKLLHWYTGVA